MSYVSTNMNMSKEHGRCGYTWPENHHISDNPKHQSCCWRETVDGTNRCVWHADPNKIDKNVDRLESVLLPKRVRSRSTPSELIDGADLNGVSFDNPISLSDVSLRDSNLNGAHFSNSKFDRCNLSDSTLIVTDFSDTAIINSDLSHVTAGAANFSESELSGTDFSNAILEDVDFSNASFGRLVPSKFDRSRDLKSRLNVDFSNADLRNSDLSGSNLRVANFLNADIQGANFSESVLREVNLKNVQVDGSTECKIQNEKYDRTRLVQHRLISIVIETLPRWWPSVGDSDLTTNQWAETAKAYHDFKKAFNNHGLVRKARHQRLRERGARRCEARTAASDDDAIEEWFYWFWSTLAWQLTGYGVSIRRIARNMGILFGSITFTYLLVEFHFSGHALTEDFSTVPEIFYYSTIAFTTTPPVMPHSDLMKLFVMTEAFLGTILIVFLGYVLGTRELF